jgi:Tfp pilus assembly protein PilV
VAAFPRLKLSRGFSLAEALIAFVVLVVAVLTLTSTYTYSQSRIALRADELQAVTFGQQYLEAVRQQVRGGVTTAPSPASQAIDVGYSLFSGQGNYSSSSPAPEITSPGNFTATSTVAQIAGTSDYDVRVDVTWPYGSVTQTVTLGTVVTTQIP